MTFDEWFKSVYGEGWSDNSEFKRDSRRAWDAAITSVHPEAPKCTVVEFCGKPAAAPCAIEEQCQYGADRNFIIEECAEAVEGCLKERQPSAFYADVIRKLRREDK